MSHRSRVDPATKHHNSKGSHSFVHRNREWPVAGLRVRLDERMLESELALLTNEQIVEGLQLTRGCRTLDLDCGTGALAIHLAQRFGTHVVALARNESQAHVARRRAARYGVDELIQFHSGQPLQLKFPSAYFDAVLSQDASECHHEFESLAGEISRVLKSGGIWRALDVFRPECQTQSENPNLSFGSFPSWLEACAILRSAGFNGFASKNLFEIDESDFADLLEESLISEVCAASRDGHLKSLLSDENNQHCGGIEFGREVIAGRLQYMLVGAVKI